MKIHETDDLWRLYRREWVIVHSITRKGDNDEDARAVFEEIKTWMLDSLGGRVHENDMTIELNTDQAGTFWAHAKVYKDNLKGEFKEAAQAEIFANVQGFDEYTIVPRNSKSDHDIRSYGKVKI